MCLAITACLSLRAQVNLDSLRQAWHDPDLSDTKRMEAIYTLITEGFASKCTGSLQGCIEHPDSAEFYAKQLYYFAAERKDGNYMVRALEEQAKACQDRVELSKALNLFDQAISVSREFQDRRLEAHIIWRKAVAYRLRSDFDSAWICLDMAELIQREIGAELDLGQTLLSKGVTYWQRDQLEQAVAAYKESLELRRRIGDTEGISWSLTHLGYFYSSQGLYEIALKYYLDCLLIQDELNWKEGYAQTLLGIGRLYRKIQDFDRARHYLQEALELHRAEGNTGSEVTALGMLANLDIDEKNYDRAIAYQNQRLRLVEEVYTDASILAGILDELSWANYLKGDLAEADAYADRSVLVHSSLADTTSVRHILNTKGFINLKRGHYQEAIRYCEQSQAITDILPGTPDYGTTRANCDCLSQAYSAIGDYENAYRNYKRFEAVKDSLEFGKEGERSILRLEYQFQYEKEALTDSLVFAKKEAVMAERSAKQQIGLGAAGGGLLLLTLLITSVRRGKKRSDELLLNILPSEVAQELKTKGSTEAQLIEDATVLFTDFKGFTSYAEKLSPQELVQDLHECFTQFDHIIAQYNIEKIKTIGDAYMAAGGLPAPNTTHAADVVEAALHIRDFIDEFNTKKIAAGLPYTKVRVGVHTGPLVAGIVGVKKFSYDIWGDTVNTASRIESSGQGGKVNISETTYQAIKHDARYTFEARGPIEAKGKGTIRMWFVERAS